MSGRIRNDAPPLGGEPPEPPRQAAPEPPGRPEPSPPAASAVQPERAPEAAVASAEPASNPAPPPADTPELSPDLKGRFDRLTRERYEARLRAEEAERRLAELERRQAAPQGYQPQPDTMEQAREQVRAEERQRQFNQACNDLYSKGRSEFGEGMDEAVRNLNAVGYGNRPDALTAITNLPDGHKVYRALGADMENAARILSLPPMAMAVELARLALGPAQQPQRVPEPPAGVTQAPEPVRPVGGHSRAPERPLNQVSMAEFIRRRDRDERLGSRIAR